MGSDALTIRVRATTAVCGMFAGEEYDVFPSHRVETFIKGGQLIWVDEPKELPVFYVRTEQDILDACDEIERMIAEGSPDGA